MTYDCGQSETNAIQDRTSQPTRKVPQANALFSVRDLNVSYHDKPALTNVTIDIAPRRITTIVGPSGCGKTSFLNCLNRLTDLVRGCEVNGSVVLDGTNVLESKLDVVALRRRVGMIFQKPNPFPMSIRRNIEMPLREHGVRDAKQRESMMEKSLADVGLWPEVRSRLNAAALELSGGQQQRLCIARAIALEPEVLLLDEPCSALDPIASGVVEDLLLSLRRRYTQIIVTHNLSQARRIADDLAIFWMRAGVGQLIESGPAVELFESPQKEDARAYLQGERG